MLPRGSEAPNAPRLWRLADVDLKGGGGEKATRSAIGARIFKVSVRRYSGPPAMLLRLRFPNFSRFGVALPRQPTGPTTWFPRIWDLQMLDEPPVPYCWQFCFV